MELKEFVRETIEQVLRGVQEAHGVAKELKGHVGSHKNDVISFDVAVTVVEDSGSTKGGSIKVAWLTLGADSKSGGSSTSITRIKFDVPVTYPATFAAPAAIGYVAGGPGHADLHGRRP